PLVTFVSRQVNSTFGFPGSMEYTYSPSLTIWTLANGPVPTSFTAIDGGVDVVNSSPMKCAPQRTSAKMLSVAPYTRRFLKASITPSRVGLATHKLQYEMCVEPWSLDAWKAS